MSEERWGDIFRPLNDSWASHDSVRHYLYEHLYTVLRDRITWQSKDYHLIEFGCREPTSAIIRMVTYDMRQKLNDKQYTLFARAVDYPLVDIQGTIYDDSEWDITVADQVLEHVKRPWKAAEELHRITKVGGLCIVATPISLHNHPNPLDCWRILPDGYDVLFPDSLWETIEEGEWGNMEQVAWYINSPITRGFTGDWLSVAKAKEIMPCFNDEPDHLWPIVIWRIYRKK